MASPDDTVDPEPTPVPLLEMLDLDSVSDAAQPDVSVEIGSHMVTGTDADETGVDLESLCRLAAEVLVEESAPEGQLDLHLVDIDTMRDLNLTHMQADEPTDVLAFPLDPDEFDASAAGDRALIGDVVMCPTVAFDQAPGHTGSYEAELALLVIHGVLHVLGHDHGKTGERLAMQARERHHLERMNFSHPVPAP